ncbi:MAG: hypothetical protein GX061_02880 [Eubacteriaceae bacterium]|nr:hypothetical protein [Eubacteriaceae bacterium]
MENQSTTQLLEQLKKTDIDDMKPYFKALNYQAYFGFSDFIEDMLAQRGMSKQQLFIEANLPQKYGYKLISGEAHTIRRDKILRLLLALKPDFKQMQRGLSLYGMNPLYAKNKRDAVIILCIERGIYTAEKINGFLSENGLETIKEP